MGTRYRTLYYEALANGNHYPRVVPPGNVWRADFGETVTHAVLAGSASWFIYSGAIHFRNPTDSLCAAFIVGGAFLIAPLIGDVLADICADVRQGWERGLVRQPEPPEVPAVEPAEESEEKRGAGRMEGEWWYTTRGSRLCCYHTPRDKYHKPIITDVRMQAIFAEVIRGTPFSELKVTEKVRGLSQPRFQILQRDWRERKMYFLHPDKTGHFSDTGRIVAQTIATTSLS
jgi:hypothetical protein